MIKPCRLKTAEISHSVAIDGENLTQCHQWLASHGKTAWTAFALGLAASPIATTLACLALRQWGKASIAGGVVVGMVALAFWQVGGV